MNFIAAKWMDASPQWVLFEGAYFALAAVLLLVAFKTKGEWVRATLGAFAMSVLAWRILAVIPSWWLYYAEGNLKWGGQGCIQVDASCIKQALKDTVVVIENAGGLGAFIVAFWLYQKKFPKQAVSGEPKLESTGGYK